MQTNQTTQTKQETNANKHETNTDSKPNKQKMNTDKKKCKQETTTTTKTVAKTTYHPKRQQHDKLKTEKQQMFTRLL